MRSEPSDPRPAVPVTRRQRGPADMRPCNRCGRTDQYRMFALMTFWYGALADLPPEGGYFYLCPACYNTCIPPATP